MSSQQASSNQPNKITFASAMETLRSMFPQKDVNYLKDKLYQTKGHMERTIEILLQEEAGIMEESPAPIQRSTTKSREPNAVERLSESQFRHNLASDFLVMRAEAVASSTGMEQLHPHTQQLVHNDEILARQLQREMYQEALEEQYKERRRKRRDHAPTPDSASSSRQVFELNDHVTQRPSSRRRSTQQGSHTSNQSGGYGASNAPAGSAQTTLKKNLANLSDAAKKRLADFKKKFTKKKEKNQEYSKLNLLDVTGDPDHPHNQL